MNRKTLLSLKPDIPCVEPYLPPQEVITTSLADDGKTLVRKSELKSIDVVQEMSKYIPEDYSLQNLALVGAVDSLKPSKIFGNSFDALDSVDFESIDSALTPTESSIDNSSSYETQSQDN